MITGPRSTVKYKFLGGQDTASSSDRRVKFYRALFSQCGHRELGAPLGILIWSELAAESWDVNAGARRTATPVAAQPPTRPH